MRQIILNFLLIMAIITGGLESKAQVPQAPSNPAMNGDMNWIITKSYDAQGNVLGESKQFFDKGGRLLQTQSKVQYRVNSSTVYTHVFASQVIRDAYGRDALTTLAAPVNNSEFSYKPDFVRSSTNTNYDYKNFDRYNNGTTETDKTDAPDIVGVSSIGSLRWYYSINNTWEPYTPLTSYPYMRQTYFRDGTGNVKYTADAGDQLKMGTGRQPSSYVYPVIGETGNYTAVRNKFFSTSEVGELAPYLLWQSMVTVNKDVNGTEVFNITDRGGHVLITGKTGTDVTETSTLDITTDTRYMAYVDGGDQIFFTDPTSQIEVYTGSTLFYQGVASGFSISSLGVQNGQVKCPTQFSYKSCSGSVCSGTVYAVPKASIHYFKITTDNTTVTISGNYTLYDMDMSNEPAVSLLSGNKLNKGYYKVVANNGDVSISYSNKSADMSYNFYNQLGQLVATIAPEGVKKLLGTGLNNYTYKAQIPFITLYEYDVRGRLVKTTDPDGGISELVYRNDDKIRFSRNAQQLIDGKYSYTNYDQYGRPTESGEYQPDANGIAFTSDMSGSSNMKNILENTSSTGGLTTGTKKDVVMTTYDIADDAGVVGYTQDAFYLGGAVSTTRKYSSIVNNNPNSTNLISQTWYNYDEEGKVVWIIQYINGLNSKKTTDFTYDDLGRLTKRVYQKNTTAETFVHYYEYDPANGHLWKVYANTQDVDATKKLQATYIYYLHGPLKRVELAGNLQGIDYTYTLQGWLKAVNNSVKDVTKDPGGDGNGNGFNADAFGMVLDYFLNDYQNTRTTIVPIRRIQTGSNASADTYSGNIKDMTWFSSKPGTITGLDEPTTYIYKYDEKYQFTESTWGRNIDFSVNPATTTMSGNWNKEKMGNPTATPAIDPYDDNGNILYLQRSNTAGTWVDKLKYNYTANTNKLASVSNEVGTPYTVTAYTYNAIGQLTGEINTSEGSDKSKYIDYDVTGKVLRVYRDAAKTKKIAEYVYDETGARIMKKLYDPVTAGNPLQNITFYNGDVIFTQAVTNGTSYGPVIPQEYEIDGGMGTRLGVYYKQSITYAYELRDHLGDVRAVVAMNGATMEVRSYSDYYPYGMVLRSGGTSYRYGYQGAYAEKDDETNWNAFELRMYDSRIARWLTLDPAGQYWSPYTAMGNNPATSTDPDGGEDNPLYDFTTHEFLGFDNYGPGGEAIFIDKVNFSSGMSHDIALQKGVLYSNMPKGSVGNVPMFFGPPMAMIFNFKHKPLLGQISMGGNKFFDRSTGSVFYKSEAIQVTDGPETFLVGGFYGLGRFTVEELAAKTAEQSLVQANRTAGNLFRDELAVALRAEGRTVNTEVYKWTPFGKRYMDLDVWHNGVNLGGIETKVGGSRYLSLQRLKDYWLGANGYPVNLVRKPTNW